MRENVRNVSKGRAGRERWEFALDGRQISAVAVGVLVIVGSAFVLGMNTGKGMARRASPAVAANSLEAFDTAHENLPTLPEPKNWEYEKLGGNAGPDASPPASIAQVAAPAASAQARVPPPARPLAPPAAAAAEATAPAADAPAPKAPAAVAAPVPAPAPAVAKPPAPAPAPRPASRPAPSAMDRAIAAVGGKPVSDTPVVLASAAKESAGEFVIQIGASSNRSDADRIAKRFASRGARVVAADVDGKRWYRVRLATYGTRSEAERALSRLSRETGVRGFVTAAR
jgi:cell division protein FtsN